MTSSTSAARKTAFVTGASYGVGAATALALARDGFDIALSATRVENLAGTLGELALLGVRTLPLPLDLRSASSIEQAMAQIVDAFGGLDVLVNNAGANLRKFAVDVTAAEWREVMEINVTGTFLLTQQVGRHLMDSKRPGAIVNIASTHGLIRAPAPIPNTWRRCSSASRCTAWRPPRRSPPRSRIWRARRRRRSPDRCSCS